MSPIRIVLSFLFLYSSLLLSTYGAQTFWPAAVPFAVRTPYLNTWQNAFTAHTSTNNWPFFWNNGVSSVGVRSSFCLQVFSLFMTQL